MCHPGLPPLPPGCTVRRRERQAAVAPWPSRDSPPVSRPRQAAPHYYCVCSPTAHRGSFRCRWHRSGFEWGHRRPFANTLGRAEARPAMQARMAAP